MNNKHGEDDDDDDRTRKGDVAHDPVTVLVAPLVVVAMAVVVGLTQKAADSYEKVPTHTKMVRRRTATAHP
jgi:hypothetical protein